MAISFSSAHRTLQKYARYSDVRHNLSLSPCTSPSFNACFLSHQMRQVGPTLVRRHAARSSALVQVYKVHLSQRRTPSEYRHDHRKKCKNGINGNKKSGKWKDVKVIASTFLTSILSTSTCLFLPMDSTMVARVGLRHFSSESFMSKSCLT